jgi:hypothetical protein
MNEYAIPSTEARNNFSHMVACAMWGDSRIVLCRYNFEMAAIIGVGDLLWLRQRDRELKKPASQQKELPPPTRYDMLLDKYLRHIDVAPEGRDDKDFFRLAGEIGELLQKGDDPRVVLAKA